MQTATAGTCRDFGWAAAAHSAHWHILGYKPTVPKGGVPVGRPNGLPLWAELAILEGQHWLQGQQGQGRARPSEDELGLVLAKEAGLGLSHVAIYLSIQVQHGDCCCAALICNGFHCSPPGDAAENST